MSFMDDIKNEFETVILPKVLAVDKLIEELGPWVQRVAFLGGPALGPVDAAITSIATVMDNAITAHEAAGQTTQSAINALASIANTVAAQAPALNIPPETAAKIDEIVKASGWIGDTV